MIVCLSIWIMPHSSPAFPDSLVGKESAWNAGDTGSIPVLGRCPGEGIGYPFQYSWASLVPQPVKNPPGMQETWVRSLGWEDPLEKERLPTPVFWPREFHRLNSPWSCKELDTTEWLSLSLFIVLNIYNTGCTSQHFLTVKLKKKF